MIGPVVVAVPEELEAFLAAAVAAGGHASPAAYFCALLRQARDRAAADRLESLLLDGLASGSLAVAEAFPDEAQLTAAAAGAWVQQAAMIDVASHHDRYMAQAVPAIAQRFRTAAARAVVAALTQPDAGVPCAAIAPTLAGLRSWPMKGFAEHRVYALLRDGRPVVLRVLHDRRGA